MPRRWSHCLAICGCVLVACWSRRAWAEPATQPRVRFEYSAADELGCPSSTQLQAAIAERLGDQPFTDDSDVAADRLRVTISRAGAGLEARLEWLDRQGEGEGERRLPSSSADCSELAHGLAFAIAVQLQLRASLASQSQPVAIPVVPAPAPAPRQAGPPPVPPERRRWLLGLGIEAEHGLIPGMTPALRAIVATARGNTWFEASVQASALETTTLPDGTGFRANALSASITPCVRTAPLAWCAAAMVGRLQVRGQGVDRVESPAALIVAAGAQAELFLPALTRLGVLVHAQVLATLTPQDITLNQTRVWSTSPILVNFGVALPVVF